MSQVNGDKRTLFDTSTKDRNETIPDDGLLGSVLLLGSTDEKVEFSDDYRDFTGCISSKAFAVFSLDITERFFVP